MIQDTQARSPPVRCGSTPSLCPCLLRAAKNSGRLRSSFDLFDIRNYNGHVKVLQTFNFEDVILPHKDHGISMHAQKYCHTPVSVGRQPNDPNFAKFSCAKKGEFREINAKYRPGPGRTLCKVPPRWAWRTSLCTMALRIQNTSKHSYELT